jgi:hypothetical protein
MKNKAIGRIVTVLLVVISLQQTGCNPDQLRKAARASDSIAASIKALILAKRELAEQGQITRDEELKLTQALFALNEAVIVFNNQAKNSKTWDESVKTALITLFTNVTNTLNQLNTQGVLGIANPGAKQRLTGIIAGMDAAIGIIKVVLT